MYSAKNYHNENCTNCTATYCSRNCDTCVDCVRCENCYHCVGLTNEKWFIFNIFPGSKLIDEALKNFPQSAVDKVNAMRATPEY